MGIVIPPSRALSQQLFCRAAQLCNARFATSLRRVNPVYTSESQTQSSCRRQADHRSILSQCRPYATATTAKNPGRPKAHTGRTAVKSTRKPATKAKAKVKVKAKPKKKAKAKPKKKVTAKPKKKVLTEKQLATKAKKAAASKSREVKEKALLTEPKSLPSTAWQVIITESAKPGSTGGIGNVSKEASAKYKSMSPEEHERLNHIANENKAKNDVAYKKWLSSFTPKQVLEANVARNNLKAAARKAGSKKLFSHIKDDRLVKRPLSAFMHFHKERTASGDMNGMKVVESGGLIGREWKALTAGEKKAYEDMAEASKKQYIVEYKTVYGVDAKMAK